MSLYTPKEEARIAELKELVDSATHWVKYWKSSGETKRLAHWNAVLLERLKNYNAALDKQPIKQS